MNQKRRERTKKIFKLLPEDENTRKQTATSSTVPNDRQPSRPKPYDEYQFSRRKPVSKWKKSSWKNTPNMQSMCHKFLLKGHTHMEVDHVHSIIERKKKSLMTMEIAVPRDWAQFLRSCSGKNNFQVTEMDLEDFKETSSLIKKSSGPFVLRKKNTMQEDFKISETVMWKFEKSKPGILCYKTNFEQEQFKELNLIRKVGKPYKCPETLPNIRESEKPISTQKYKDLMTLLQWVPKEFHSFYKNLKHCASASDVPEIADL